MSPLIDTIRTAVIGSRQPLRTPFGDKPLVYADYTASGRALTFIEDYIRREVLPWYANTHSESSATGARSTALRERAREQVRSAVNGTRDDKVIFCGAGATAAINKLVDLLNLRLPRDLSERYQLEARIPAAERPVVFIGPYEHHSNELPWRESIAEVVRIPLTTAGQIDLNALERELAAHASRPLKIGSFSAASNVTGIRSDVPAVTALLKRHGALAFWDYAAAAPYVGIDMNGEQALDGVFISPHKFVGGPGTPGVLVVKRQVLHNSVPAVVGGGTVLYVTPEDHRFIEDVERREEGGTPAIVESIRAGLVFDLQQQVGTAEIERREHALVQAAMARLGACPGLEILGGTEAKRLSILSLRFHHSGADLHYSFVVALLNDLFGIQARGGCSCAGPYGHSLLGMDMARSRALEAQIRRGITLLRPGWVRLNFNYFIDEEEFDYLLRAIELIAAHGWRLLPWYQRDAASGLWRYRGEAGPALPPAPEFDHWQPAEAPSPLPLAGVWEAARDALLSADHGPAPAQPALPADAEALRWFLEPRDALGELQAEREAAGAGGIPA